MGRYCVFLEEPVAGVDPIEACDAALVSFMCGVKQWKHHIKKVKELKLKDKKFVTLVLTNLA